MKFLTNSLILVLSIFFVSYVHAEEPKDVKTFTISFEKRDMVELPLSKFAVGDITVFTSLNIEEPIAQAMFEDVAINVIKSINITNTVKLQEALKSSFESECSAWGYTCTIKYISPRLVGIL